MDLLLSLRSDISVEDSPSGEIHVQTPLQNLTLKKPSAGMRTVIHTLASDGGTEDDLADAFLEVEGPQELAKFYYVLNRLHAYRMICRSVVSGGTPIATIVPLSPFFEYEPTEIRADERYALSRFAYCRKEGARTVLECPTSYARLILHDWRASAAVHCLSHPRSSTDLRDEIPGLSKEALTGFLGLLASGGMAHPVTRDGLGEEDRDPVKRQWDFHDLLFHSRSRMGRTDKENGANYRFQGEIDPLPACKPPMSGEFIELPEPDMDRLFEEDFPFSLVLENRQSVRDYDDRPLTPAQLGEFLFRSARVRNLIDPDPSLLLPYQASSRPYASGGASYELEIYLTINTCEEIESGLYHYDPLHHRLYRISERNPLLEELLKDAWRSAAKACVPQILVTLSARFQRVAWKYESMAYATILKDAGVLIQTMYLVAAAMDLAPCGLGCGNSDLFARAAGLDYLVESSVAEFMLGRKRI
jgi:SagB-type dehydrogenase family enzyme